MTGLRWSLEIMSEAELDALLEFLEEHHAALSVRGNDPDDLLGSFHYRAKMLKTAMVDEQAAADAAGEEPGLAPPTGPAPSAEDR